MNIEKSNIRELAKLSDAEFSKIIYEIALSMGLTPSKAAEASKNTPFFRVILSSASDSDLENMIGKVGRDKLAQISEGLKNKH